METNQLVAGLLLAEGVGAGILAGIMFLRKRAKLARFRRTRGEVVEVREHPSSEGGPTRHPVIRYTTASGQAVTFESKFGRANWRIQPGDRLEILADPAAPADAEVAGFMAQWALPVVFALIAASSLIGAPLVYLLLRR